MLKLPIFESDGVAKLCPVSYQTTNQYGGTTCRPSYSRANPDSIGCVWTGEFDLNTIRGDGESLNPERITCGLKKTRILIGPKLQFIVTAKLQTILSTKSILSKLYT